MIEKAQERAFYMFFMFECVVQQRRIALSVFTFFFGGSISRCFPKPKTVGG
jgi:hypothetical protein